MTEDERIAQLSRCFAKDAASAPGVVHGIGDDAAILSVPSDEKIVWTVDAHVEGVHFEREWLSMEELGWKSFMAAASDLAAMGARPLGATSALTLPADFPDQSLLALAQGQADAARAIGTVVVGGNLSKGQLSITTSLLGAAQKPLLRSGARAGDRIFVSGTPGLAAAGLALSSRGAPSDDPRSATCIDAWKKPRARISEGLAIASIAHACMDVSDGLALDVARMTEASGVAAVIDADALLAHAGALLVDVANALALKPLELALFGGEDYLLIAAANVDLPGFTAIGEIVEGKGVALRTGSTSAPLERRGFTHF